MYILLQFKALKHQLSMQLTVCYRTHGYKVTNSSGGFWNYYTKLSFNYYVVWMLPMFGLPDKRSSTVFLYYDFVLHFAAKI
jgi:hypothetical protein